MIRAASQRSREWKSVQKDGDLCNAGDEKYEGFILSELLSRDVSRRCVTPGGGIVC